MKRIVGLIAGVKRVFLIGVGREGLSTRAFAMRLMHLGKEVHWIWDDTTQSICKGDLLLATSGSGEIGHIQYVVERAKSNGAEVAVITGTPDRRTPQIADCVLWVPACVYHGKENVVPSVQPMGNLFEQCVLIAFDIIVMQLAERLKQSKQDMEARHRNVE